MLWAGHACLALGLDPAHHSLTQRSPSLEQCPSSTAVPWQPAHTSCTSVWDSSPPVPAWEYWWDQPPEPGWSPAVELAGIPCLGVSFQCGSDALVMLTCTRPGPQFFCCHWCHIYTHPHQFCEAEPPLSLTQALSRAPEGLSCLTNLCLIWGSH